MEIKIIIKGTSAEIDELALKKQLRDMINIQRKQENPTKKIFDDKDFMDFIKHLGEND